MAAHESPLTTRLNDRTSDEMAFYEIYRRIRRLLTKSFIKKAKKRRILKHVTIEDRFTEIYKLLWWQSKESVSGVGSELAQTEDIRKHLPILLKTLSIESVFDAPCGDFNWMKYVLSSCQVNYIGGDIVLPIVDNLNKTYVSENIRFIHIDLTKDLYPTADLMIVRDCFVHLSFADTKAFIRNFVDSDIKYLLASTYVNLNYFENRDIKTGDFRGVDLFSEPYNFPKDVLSRFPDRTNIEMCLWNKEQIGSALRRFSS